MKGAKRKIGLGLLVLLVLAGLFAAVLWVGRYSAPVSWLLEKTPDRVRRKFAALFLKQPTPAELAKLRPAIPGKAARLRAEVLFPEEFAVSIFATPPAVNYPVFVTAAPDGTLYISSDGNGSLDAKPHRGRVLRVRDVNRDGVADEVKAFVPDVDAPRGLVWDHDRLYLLHPPELTEYVDKDGDGVIDSQRTLVKGIGYPLSQRAGDHSSNGLTLGVDGWLYAAIGDFGFVEAEGADGRKLQLRGGGIVRVRTNGTGLELWAHGTRNVFEVAVSPMLEIFGRDNSGDDGWNVWLHHFSGQTEHGWPFLFRNFPEERVPALADYGAGSGAGAAWLDEGNLPARWNGAPFTADWGRERVFRHGLTPRGATFDVTQEEFCQVPRVTDVDVDAGGAIYVTSWKGASFMWVGREVGFVVRAVPKGAPGLELPDYTTASDDVLLQELSTASYQRRLAAQRALVRRGAAPATMEGLARLVSDARQSTATRVAALFAVSQLSPTAKTHLLERLSRDVTLMPWVIRAWADAGAPLPEIGIAALREAFRSKDARVRLEAVMAGARCGGTALQPELLVALLDSDPIVAHTASRALVQLGAWRDCLAALQQEGQSEASTVALTRVLAGFPLPEVADALIARLAKPVTPRVRTAIAAALARCAKVEAPWDGTSWGTRPDTRGPFFKPQAWSHTEVILSALRQELLRGDADDLPSLGREIARNRLSEIDLFALLGQRAEQEPKVFGAIVTLLTTSTDLDATALPLLRRAVPSPSVPVEQRAKAAVRLAQVANAGDWEIVLSQTHEIDSGLPTADVRAEFRAALLQSETIAAALTPARQLATMRSDPLAMVADAVLLRIAGTRLGAASNSVVEAKQALDAGWADSRRRLQIMAAAVWANDSSRAGDFVALAESGEPAQSATAKETLGRLGIDPESFRAELAGPKIAGLSEARVLAAVESIAGDASSGAKLFQQVGCVACHTISKNEAPKGPMLGGIAAIYRRRELAEAILVPNRSLAQGFAASRFNLRSGEEIEGFIVRETPDLAVVRTINAIEKTIPSAEIVAKVPLKSSLMPEGLVSSLTVSQFASLLAYLESLPGGK